MGQTLSRACNGTGGRETEPSPVWGKGPEQMMEHHQAQKGFGCQFLDPETNFPFIIWGPKKDTSHMITKIITLYFSEILLSHY